MKIFKDKEAFGCALAFGLIPLAILIEKLGFGSLISITWYWVTFVVCTIDKEIIDYYNAPL
jgi:hypothetical protein